MRFTLDSLEPRALFAAGGLDTSFGTKGVIRGEAAISVGGQFFGPAARAIHALADGKFIVAGTMAVSRPYSADATISSPDSVLLARFNADATLDTTFGGVGYTVTRLTNRGKPIRAAVDSIDVDSSGRFIVAGRREGVAFVARFTSGGELDTTFGIAGRFDAVFDGSEENGKVVVRVTNDGRILVSMDQGSSHALLRLRVDGRADPKFNGGAPLILPAFDENDYHARPRQIDTTASGRIIVTSFNHGGTGAGQIVAVTPSGKLDRSFGRRGRFSETRLYAFTSVLVESSGAIYLAGTNVYEAATDTYLHQVALYRLSPAGAIDSSFSSSPILSTSALLGRDVEAPSLFSDSDGVRVLYSDRSIDKQELVRFRANGQLDADFAANHRSTFVLPSIARANSDGQLRGTTVETARNTFANVLPSLENDYTESAWAATFTARVVSASSVRKTHDFPRLSSGFTALAVRADGKLISSTIELDDAEFRVFNANGALDKSFTGDGSLVAAGQRYSFSYSYDLLPLGNNTVVNYLAGYQQSDGLSRGLLIQSIRANGTAGPYQESSATDDSSFGYVQPLPHFQVAYAYQQESETISGIIRSDGSRRYYIPEIIVGEDSVIDGPAGLVRGVVASTSSLLLDGYFDDLGSALFEVRPDRSFDPIFGNGGRLPFTGTVIAVQDDGKILYTANGKLKRLNANGSADSSYVGSSLVRDTDHFTLDEAGRVIAWRQIDRGDATGDVQIIRLTKTGSADKMFSGDGVAVVDTKLNDLNGNVMVTADNKIVVTNFSKDGRKANWFAARLSAS